MLVSVGRKPNSEILGLDRTQVRVGQRGFIQVNKHLQTDDPAIYAIGDVVGEPMLAHKASHEGRTAVEHIAGHKVAFEPNAIPAVVFTDPEIAWAGLTETQAEKEGREIKVAKFPWAASGRALTIDRTEGMTKLIIDPATERVLGVGIVGAGAGELIAEGTLAIEMAARGKRYSADHSPSPDACRRRLCNRQRCSSGPARICTGPSGSALSSFDCMTPSLSEGVTSLRMTAHSLEPFPTIIPRRIFCHTRLTWRHLERLPAVHHPRHY